MKNTGKNIHEKKSRDKPFGLAWFIVLLVIATLVFSYFSFFRPSPNGVKGIINQLHFQTAYNAKERVDGFMNSNLKDLDDLASAVSLAGSQDEARKEIERFIKNRNWFYDISLIDAQGMETLRFSQFSIFGPEDLTNYSMRDFFMASKEGQVFISDIETTEEAILYVLISLPLGQSQDGMGGVLSAKLSLREIENIVTATKVGKTGKAYLVDSKGIVIAHPNPSFVLKKADFSGRNVVQEALGIGSGGGGGMGGMDMGMGGATDTNMPVSTGETCAEYMNEDNVWVYAVGIPTAVPKGVIVAEEPQDEVLASYYRIRSAAISFNFLAAMLLFLFVFNNRKLSKLFSMLRQRDDQLSQEAVRREKDLEELEKTTKLLVRRDVDLSEANRRLEELDVVKSDFVSIAAHQLRTPLTGIKWSFLALLEKEMGHLDGEQKKIIEDGLGAINHTIKLINDLLNVAHIEEGKFGFNFKNESIEPVIQKSFERFESLAGEKGIWLSADFSKEKLPLVSIDSEKIDLVLDNLLDNAIKYTSPGGKVRFKTEFKNEKIIIIVEDTGIGIPRSQLSRAFTKFFRGENAVLFQTSGTGLGLYMIKNIIDRHCGTITVNSEENKGTTFTIELPKVCKCKLQEK